MMEALNTALSFSQSFKPPALSVVTDFRRDNINIVVFLESRGRAFGRGILSDNDLSCENRMA